MESMSRDQSKFGRGCDFRGRRVYVIGLGKRGTGAGVCRVLSRLGAQVTVADVKGPGELEAQLTKIQDLPVKLELGGQAYATIETAELVVISPGVPLGIPALQRAREAGIEIVSEIEVAYWLAKAAIIGITGTKGKTTTTALLAQLLQDAGWKARAAGNIGRPLIEEAYAAGPDEWLVSELSSFQLETVRDFRPHVAAFLNFWPDHLEGPATARLHETVEEYWSAKIGIFRNQGPGGWAVLNADHERVWELKDRLSAHVLGFSRRRDVEQGIFLADGVISVRRCKGGPPAAVCRASSLRLRGNHNVENALAAVAAMAALGAPLGLVEHTLSGFAPLPHRLEPVGTVDGVEFINDSQATNPSAVAVALDAMEKPTILIAGGRSKVKVEDLKDLAAAAARRCKALVTLGEAGPVIAEAARMAAMGTVEESGSLEEAVRAASRLASPGDVVLLSPACASFDMFDDFEQRGEAFKRAVASLGKGGAA
jgi:UDP-N-acetylmuramoylalanine--D-glutamate ligase